MSLSWVCSCCSCRLTLWHEISLIVFGEERFIFDDFKYLFYIDVMIS